MGACSRSAPGKPKSLRSQTIHSPQTVLQATCTITLYYTTILGYSALLTLSPMASDDRLSWFTNCLWSVTGMNVIAGTVAGASGVLTGHPFDTVKVRLQSQSYSAPIYRNTFHCFFSIFRKEGIKGLFKGVSSPLVGVTAINTLLFGVYGFFLESQLQPGQTPNLWQIFVAGAGSGFVNSFISGPVELSKIQMQNQIGKGTFRSPSDCMHQVWRRHGLIGCYRGLWPTILRETPSYGAYFACFEGIRRAWSTEENQGQLDNSQLMLAGGISGIAGWMSTYPVDVVKTRIQAQPLFPTSDTKPTKTSLISWFRSILKNEGMPGFFRGATATVIRAFPTNAVIFTVYALTMRWLDDVRPSKVDCK
jgi:solute carrier family 25 carnitine/acylcarnitine transporter 20/29